MNRLNTHINQEPINKTTLMSHLVDQVVNYCGSWFNLNTQSRSILSACTQLAPSSIQLLLSYTFYENPDEKMAQLLDRKNLTQHLLVRDEQSCSITSPLSEHVRWLFHAIYSKPFPHFHHAVKDSKIARYVHGIQHVSRVAVFVTVFANLYRKHGDAEALALTELDLKLLQLAALFHDAAREDEGRDRWDHESALIFYFYLTKLLGVDPIRAKLFAEAVANKDIHPKGYFEIIQIHDDQCALNPASWTTWRFNRSITSKTRIKSIHQKIIHDADCLDIIRARPAFNAEYLDFYQDIASNPSNQEAFEELAHLITEARSLIETQGDTYTKSKPSIKVHYEHEKAYERIRQDLTHPRYRILDRLSQGLVGIDQLQQLTLVDRTPYDPKKGFTPTNMTAAMREGLIFARALLMPNVFMMRNNKPLEAGIHIELRKVLRERGIATRTAKANRLTKEGNPLRSVSMIGFGAQVFSGAGYLIVDPAINEVVDVFSRDAGTGFGKQKKYFSTESVSVEARRQQLADLHRILKKGSRAYQSKCGATSNHNEILYNVRRYDAVFFTEERTYRSVLGLKYSTHPSLSFLEAIFLKTQYQMQRRETRQKYLKWLGQEQGNSRFIARFGENETIPLYHYSAVHHQLIWVDDRELTPENLIQRWTQMCSDYISSALLDHTDLAIYDMPVLTIKKTSPFGHHKVGLPLRQYVALDNNYSSDLQEKLNASILAVKQALIEEHEHRLIEEMNAGLSICSDKFFFNVQKNPRLIQKIDKIHAAGALSKIITTQELFSEYLQASIDDLKKKEIRLYTLSKCLELDSIKEKIQQGADVFLTQYWALINFLLTTTTAQDWKDVVFDILELIKNHVEYSGAFDLEHHDKKIGYSVDFLMQRSIHFYGYFPIGPIQSIMQTCSSIPLSPESKELLAPVAGEGKMPPSMRVTNGSFFSLKQANDDLDAPASMRAPIG